MKFSVVEDTVNEILSTHAIASSDYEVYDEQAAAELINYFHEKEDISIALGAPRFQWSLLIDEYPDPIRGYVHIAFIDDGLLYTMGYEFWKDAWNFEVEE